MPLQAPLLLLHWFPDEEGFPNVQAETTKTCSVTTGPHCAVFHYKEYAGSTSFVITLQVL